MNLLSCSVADGISMNLRRGGFQTRPYRAGKPLTLPSPAEGRGYWEALSKEVQERKRGT
jgi:hypothetical protein